MAKLSRVREWLRESAAAAVVLTQAGPVAWLTGGLTNPIERGHPASPLWIVVRPDDETAITTEVEAPRLLAEGDLEMPLVPVPWFEPGAFANAVLEIVGAPADAIASDGDAAFGIDASDDLARLRLALVPDEQGRLRELARDAAEALEQALRTFRPGQLDTQIQARVADALEQRAALAVCLIVGGDERIERYRHPLAAGVPVEHVVMAVVVAERGGLHAAATRYASDGPLPEGVAEARRAALAIEQQMLAACGTGTTYGEVLDTCERAYASAGHAGAWREHYQGGPIAYRQREFEVAPGQGESAFTRTRIAAGHALAWNPSVAGGGKAEDTYLVGLEGLTRITDSGDWPLLGDGRPAAIDVRSGRSAEVAA
ncbi:MAG TPA: M24 family metallopeptidase [Gaiellales bacterium]